MSDPIVLISKAHSRKPKFGEKCNHCGWCCLTQVCAVGQELTGSSRAPCKLLIRDGDNHYCKLGECQSIREVLAMGEGCDAKTQQELIDDMCN